MNKKIALAAAAAAMLAASAADAALIHSYDFNGDYTDSVGGVTLSGNGGSFSGGVLNFGANQGPTFGSTLGSTYTIVFRVSLDQLSGYRKLISFNGLGSDNGLYNLSGALNFYPVATGPAAFTAGQFATVAFAHDSSGVITAAVDGVTAFTFSDVSGYAAPGPLAFFHDDTATGGGEASAGVSTSSVSTIPPT